MEKIKEDSIKDWVITILICSVIGIFGAFILSLGVAAFIFGEINSWLNFWSFK